jgi:hypothetical protein
MADPMVVLHEQSEKSREMHERDGVPVIGVPRPESGRLAPSENLQPADEADGAGN